MQVQILFAEQATSHPDGTFSALKAGLAKWFTETDQGAIQGFLILRIAGSAAEAGKHIAKVLLMDEDGKKMLPDMVIEMETPPSNGTIGILAGVNQSVPVGKYVFTVVLDSQEAARYPVQIIKRAAPSALGPKKK